MPDPLTPPDPPALPGAPPTLCVTCGAPLTGPFCAQCGQRVRAGRLTLRSVLADAWQHVVSLDSSLWRTTVGLVRRPAALIRDVLAGRTVRYTGPARYFLLAVTAAQLAALAVGDVSEFAGGVAEGFNEGRRSGDASDTLDEGWLAANLERLWVLAFVGFVPFVTLWSRVLLRRSGLTLAEHAVVHLYLQALVALGFGLAIGVNELTYPLIGDWGNVPAVALLVAPFGLAVWAAPALFGRGRVRSVVGLVASLALGFASYATAFGLFAAWRMA